MPRLIWVFAGHIFILLVLSCYGSNYSGNAHNQQSKNHWLPTTKSDKTFKTNILPYQDNGPVYKTNSVRTKSLSDNGPDQIWLCKQYLSVPKIWSGLRSRPSHVQGPQSDRIWSSTKSGYVNAPCSSDQTKCLTFGGKSQRATKMANRQHGANWSNDETWIIIRIWSL